MFYSLYIFECLKYLKRYASKFKKICDLPGARVIQTRQIAANQCPNDLFVPICTPNMSAQNPAIMIPRLFNALPIDDKMIEINTDFIQGVLTIFVCNLSV